MLSVNALADAIMSAIQQKITYQNLDQTLPSIGHAIAKYLCRNTDVLYAWSGVIPGFPPMPDSVVMYQTKNIAGDINMYPTGVMDPVMNGVILGKQITDGIKTFIITAASGWAVAPGKFKASPSIILPPTGVNDHSKHWLLWAQVIVKTYKTYINPSPLLGMHASYLAPPGSGASMTSIF